MKKLRVDTRDTKPKLRALTAATCIFLAAAVLAFMVDFAQKDAVICLLVALYGLATTEILLWAFQEQIAYNPYSYNTILYFGFALFALSVTLTHLVLGVWILCAPDAYTQQDVIRSMLSSAKTYMVLSAPFIFVFFSGALHFQSCADCP